jgi:hypothetical protein
VRSPKWFYRLEPTEYVAGFERPPAIRRHRPDERNTMTAIETAAELNTRSHTCEAELTLDPSDITFHDLSRDTVLIQVNVRNDSEHRSSPTIMTLESAAFGAFVPGRPLAILRVPAIEPGQSRVLSVEAGRPHPASLGAFDRVPPKRVLTAQNAAPQGPAPQRRGNIATAIRQILLRSRDTAPANRAEVVNKAATAPTRIPFLAPDIWEFFGREQPHWAGNINVFMRNREVERHFARDLRIYAGRTNLTIFDVGDPGKPDAYAFELKGIAPDWKAALYDMTDKSNFVFGSSDTPVQEKKWWEVPSGFAMMTLAVRPPVVCEDGNVQVHVTRRSSGKTAIVEFNLNPTAQGPGCYIA